MILETLQTDLEQLKRKIFNLEGRFQEYEKQQKTNSKLIDDISEQLRLYEKAIAVLTQASEISRKQLIPFIENLVTKAIQFNFSNDYRFKIQFIERVNRIDCQFLVIKKFEDKEMEMDPYELASGGINDTIAVALKIITKILLKQESDGPLIFDETFKFLSKDRSINTFRFLSEISKEFELQIILISHDSNLYYSDEIKELVDCIYKAEQIEKNNSKLILIK